MANILITMDEGGGGGGGGGGKSLGKKRGPTLV